MLFQLNISSMSFAIVVLKYKCTRLVSQKENYNGYNLLSKIHKTVDLSEDNCTGDLLEIFSFQWTHPNTAMDFYIWHMYVTGFKPTTLVSDVGVTTTSPRNVTD